MRQERSTDASTFDDRKATGHPVAPGCELDSNNAQYVHTSWRSAANEEFAFLGTKKSRCVQSSSEKLFRYSYPLDTLLHAMYPHAASRQFCPVADSLYHVVYYGRANEP